MTGDLATAIGECDTFRERLARAEAEARAMHAESRARAEIERAKALRDWHNRCDMRDAKAPLAELIQHATNIGDPVSRGLAEAALARVQAVAVRLEDVTDPGAVRGEVGGEG